MSLLVSLDIETESITDDSNDALYPHLSRITCVGLWCPDFACVFRDLKELKEFIESNDLEFVGQNFQFDLKHLAHNGIQIPMDKWVGDTRIMAGLLNKKIPESWLKEYEHKRIELNKNLKKGKHRKAGEHSLKTMAPYFLGVEPFWETPENHDNDEYVLKDCEYTYLLYQKLKEELDTENNLKFYETHSQQWAKMLTAATIAGISLDLDLLTELKNKTNGEAIAIKEQLDKQWSDAYDYVYQIKKEELKSKYKTEKGYLSNLEKLPRKANLDSPAQLLMILRDYFKYDLTDFNGKESTGKEVLQKLGETHKDIALFYEYRKKEKLLTAFLPTYEKLNNKGILHCSFNVEGTRTGRLSSSDPNLQQVAGPLHDLFVARPGYKLITKDLSAIEPRICAFLTEDPLLCELMIEGGDFHSENARIMFGLECTHEDIKSEYTFERKVAKEVGLALLYGAGPRRIQQSATKYGFNWSLKKCKDIHKRFKSTYKKAFEFKTRLDARAEAGQPIKTPFGRVHIYHNPDKVFMTAFNTLVQSSASDLLLDSQKKCMLEYKKRDLKAHLLLAVHDESVTECLESDVEEVEKIIEFNMTNYDLETKYGKIPLTVEGTIGKTWSK